jgi:hypothetical protein
MTATDTPTLLTEQEYEAALNRLNEYKRRLDDAERITDADSLQYARDLTSIYEDGRWVKDLPPVTKTHHRGRPVDPKSKSRLAKWVKQTVGLAPRTTYRLRSAEVLSRGISMTTWSEKFVTEATLRPLASLRRLAGLETEGWQRAGDGRYPDAIKQAWELAVELAAGETPTGSQVEEAVKKWKATNLPHATVNRLRSEDRKLKLRNEALARFRELLDTDQLATAQELVNEQIRLLKEKAGGA